MPKFRELSRFPAVRRDLALLVDEAVTAAAVTDCVRDVVGGALEDIRIFDVYRGEGIDPGRKSLAIALTLRDPSRTLTDNEVNQTVAEALTALQTRLNASLRE